MSVNYREVLRSYMVRVLNREGSLYLDSPRYRFNAEETEALLELEKEVMTEYNKAINGYNGNKEWAQ